jgi:hypothetical protein
MDMADLISMEALILFGGIREHFLILSGLYIDRWSWNGLLRVMRMVYVYADGIDLCFNVLRTNFFFGRRLGINRL